MNVALPSCAMPARPSCRCGSGSVRAALAVLLLLAGCCAQLAAATVLQSVTVINDHAISVTYSAAMNNSNSGNGARNPANYVLTLGLGQGSLNANPDTVSGGSPTYTLTWNSGAMSDSQDVTVVSSAQDAGGNPLGAGGSQSALGAGVGPPLLVSVLPIDANPTTASTLHFQATFNKPVNFSGTLALALTGTANGGTPVVTGAGTAVLSVTVAGVSGSGTLGLSFAPGNIADAALPADPLVTGWTPAPISNSYIVNIPATTATAVTSSVADGTYLIGAAIPFQVAFSGPVYVTGTPLLTLSATNGGTPVTVAYSGGSSSSTLSFAYTVHAGDTSAGVGVAVTGLSGGTIVDGQGNAAVLAPFPALAGRTIIVQNAFITAVNGNWGTAATWQGNAVPANTDDVVIAHVVTLAANTVCNSLTFAGSGTPSIARHTITVTGGAITVSSASATIGCTIATAAAQLTLSGGSLTVTQPLPAIPALLGGGLDLSAQGSATLILAAGVTHTGTLALGGCQVTIQLAGAGTATMGGAITGESGGALILATGTLILANGGNNYSGTTEVMGATSLKMQGDVGALTGTSQITIDQGATLAIVATGVVDPTLNPNRIPDGCPIIMKGGTLSMTSPTNANYSEVVGIITIEGTAATPNQVVLTAGMNGSCQLTADGAPQSGIVQNPVNGPSLLVLTTVGVANLFASGFADNSSVAFVTVGTTHPAIYQAPNGFTTGVSTAVSIADGPWSAPATWLNGVLPGPGTTAVIRNQVAFDQNFPSVNGLSFDSSTGGTPRLYVPLASTGFTPAFGYIYVELPAGGTISCTANTVATTEGVSFYASGGAITFDIQPGATLTCEDNQIAPAPATNACTFFLGSLTKIHNGTLVFNLPNTDNISLGIDYTYDLVLQGGTFTMLNPNSVLSQGSGVLPYRTVSVATGATFNLGNAANYTFAGLVGIGGAAGTVTGTAASNATLGLESGTTSFPGAITGALNLVINGNATFSGTLANTYAGTTTIAGGALTVSKVGVQGIGGTGLPAAAAPVVVMQGGASLVLNLDQTLHSVAMPGAGCAISTSGLLTILYGVAADPWSGPLSGSGGLALQQGQLVLAAANTYTGPTTIAAPAVLSVTGSLAAATDISVAGALSFAAGQTVNSLQGSGLVSLPGGATLTVANGDSLIFSGQLSGPGGFALQGSTPWFFAGGVANSYGGATQILLGASLIMATPGTANFVPAGGGLIDQGTFDLHGSSQQIGILQGNGGVTNSANGGLATLTVTGGGNYSGVISDGAAAQTALTVAGGVLQTIMVQTYTGNTQLAGGAQLILGIDQTLFGLTGNGTIEAPGHTLTLNIGAGAPDFFAGSVVNSTALSKSGAGTLILSGAGNNYNGVTQIAAGVLELFGGATLGQGNALVVIAANAILELGGGAALPAPKPLSLAGMILCADGSATAVNGTITLTQPATLRCDAGQLSIGPVTGAFQLVLDGAVGTGLINQTLALGGAGVLKVGNGQWVVAGAQPYGGVTEVATGRLVVTGSIAASSQLLIDPAGTFIAAANQALQALNGSGNVQLSGTSVLTLATAVGQSTFSGAISGTGAISIAGPGTQSFDGANFYTGGTTINGGTLALALGGTCGGPGTTTTVNPGGILRLDGGIQIPASQTIVLAGGTIVGSSGSNTILAPIALAAPSAINSGLAGTSNGLQINGPVNLGSSLLSLLGSSISADAINGVISGSGGIDMAGTGSWSITATNSYLGTTVIDAGTLSIAGLIPGDVTVNPVGTLSGTGIILGTVTANGAATIAPGTTGSVGTLNLGNLNTVPGNTLDFEVGSVSDLIQVNGPYAANGNVVITPGAQFGPGTYTLVTASGPVTMGTLTPAVLSITAGSQTFAAFLQVAGNALQLVVDDGSRPQVTQITTDVGSGTYYWQQVINISVTFNKPVQLSGGNLLLAVNAHHLPDLNPVVVTSVPGLTSTIVGAYTVSLFDWTPKLDVVSLSLSAGATLRNFANNDAILTLPPPSGSYKSLASQETVVIDNQTPAISVNNTLSLPIHTIAAIDTTLLSATDFETPNQLTYTLISAPSQGVLQVQVSPGTWADVSSSAPGNTWAQSDIASGNLRYLHNGANSGNDIFFFTVTDVFIANSDGLSKAKTTPFTPFRIIALGVPPPVVNPFNVNLVFEENSAVPIPIAAANDIVADSATTVLNPGSLVVTLANATSDDHLTLNTGGLVTLNGSIVLVGGNAVGSYTSGDVSGTTPMVITLNTANATVTASGAGALTTLLQNIAYAYLGNQPSNVPLRTVTVVVSDLAASGGGASLSYSKTISIDPYNHPPRFAEIQAVAIPGTSTAAALLNPALANPASAATNTNVALTLMATFTDIESLSPSAVQLSGVGSVNPDGSITTSAGGIARLVAAPTGPSPLSAPPPPNAWQIWLQYTPPLNQSGLADTFTITASDFALPPLAGVTTDLTRVQVRSVSQLITVNIGTLNDVGAPLIVSNPPLEAQTGANLKVPLFVGTVGTPVPAGLIFAVVGPSPPPGIQITTQAVSGGNQQTLFWPAPLMPSSATVYDFSIQVFDPSTGKVSVQPVMLLLHGIPTGGG